MTAPVLLESTEGGVARLTLNRPDKRNALNGELVQALKGALARTAVDEFVRVVTIAGAGKDFCAGADLAELERVASQGYEESLADARSLASLFAHMRSHPRPLVALVHGRALAGGCGLATACDLVLAREDAELGYPEVHLGFVPALVMTILRRRVGEGRAFELAVRGARHSAAEARDLGLVNRVFPAATFDADVARYVADIASLPPSAVAATKSLLHDLDALGFERGLERAAEVNARARASEECRTGVRQFLDKSKRGDRA
ncbi:MAG: enoyl-CoA hydratase/isomerase family protein [Gemmatimonadetes bacterium]|nr:enoyl-CoA hydratase/isomerase family protein [Gemmatimonadota bacterium]